MRGGVPNAAAELDAGTTDGGQRSKQQLLRLDRDAQHQSGVLGAFTFAFR